MSGRMLVSRGLDAADAPYATNAIAPRTASALASGLTPNRRNPFAMELAMNSGILYTPRHEKSLA